MEKLPLLILMATLIISAHGSFNSSPAICLTETGDLTMGCVAMQVPWKSTFMYLCPGKEDNNYEKKDCTCIVETPDAKGPYSCKREECAYNVIHSDLSNVVETGILAVHSLDKRWRTNLCLSDPDYCKHVPCRPPPYNMTECKEIRGKPCCSDYVCGRQEHSNESVSHCVHTRCSGVALMALYSEYPRRNPDGSPCSAFIDVYNCHDSLVITCKEKEKSGRCPTANEMDVNIDTGFARLCVGDYTCPDDQKCCTFDPSGEGLCMEPVTD